MKMLMVILAAVCAAIISGTGAFGAEKKTGDAKGLFEKKCGACHGLDRATSQRRTAQEWERTVLRMKESLGAPLTDQEARTIIDYLSKSYRAR
jgi:mono/diheme cytochrome c family protein